MVSGAVHRLQSAPVMRGDWLVWACDGRPRCSSRSATADSSVAVTLPDHVKEIDALRAFRLLRLVDSFGQFGRTGRGGARNAADVADETEHLGPHATSLGDRSATWVSSVAGGEAAGAPTLAALSLDVLAVLQ